MKINKAYIIRHIIRYAQKLQTQQQSQLLYNVCVDAAKKRLEKNGIPVEMSASGEEEYIRFWQQFCKKVEPYTYRFFSRIVGPNPHIVPEDIASLYIEPILNPIKFRDFYSDKNMYARYLSPKSAIPTTYISRIEGGLIKSNKYLTYLNGGG